MNATMVDRRILGPPRRTAVRMPLEDIQCTARDAQQWGRCETGGALYGLWTNRGEPVVQVASEAGPGAVREFAHFAQDAEYLTEVNRELWNRFGIQYIGNWHSHHCLDIPHPSGGDVQQVRGLAQKTGLPRLVQVVLTYELKSPPRSHRCLGVPRSRPPRTAAPDAFACRGDSQYHGSRHLPRIRLNAFVYEDAQEGSYSEADIWTTECASPVRAALKGSRISAFEDVPEKFLYPVDHISFRQRETQPQAPEEISGILSALAEQIERLPQEVATRVEAVPSADKLILRLPLSQGGWLVLVYNSQLASLKPTSVHMTSLAMPEPVDITAVVSSCKCGYLLDVVYECAERIHSASAIGGQDHVKATEPSMGHSPHSAPSRVLPVYGVGSPAAERRHGHVE